jgi:NAD(P)H-flavin reductase
MQEQSTRPKAAVASRPRPKLPKARLVRRRDQTSDLWIIWLEPEVPFTFKPGQYCTLGLEGVERAYSIVSAPHEPKLEIFVELVPVGELTPPMYQLQVGETLTLRPTAKGIFTLDSRFQSHLMVATVTGIAPFVSIVRDYFHRGGTGHRFYILYGASYQDENAYTEELAGLARAHPEVLAYVPTVSRPGEPRNTGWGGETGRVNTIVAKHIEGFGLDRASTLIYACGHPGMITSVKEQFLPQGFRVKEERFWKE